MPSGTARRLRNGTFLRRGRLLRKSRAAAHTCSLLQSLGNAAKRRVGRADSRHSSHRACVQAHCLRQRRPCPHLLLEKVSTKMELGTHRCLPQLAWNGYLYTATTEVKRNELTLWRCVNPRCGGSLRTTPGFTELRQKESHHAPECQPDDLQAFHFQPSLNSDSTAHRRL